MIGVARIAEIHAPKRISDLIPFCHPQALSFVGPEGTVDADAGSIVLTAEAWTTGPTGVEMEALTAASVAALMSHDMVRRIEGEAENSDVMLLEKSDGRSGLRRQVHLTRPPPDSVVGAGPPRVGPAWSPFPRRFRPRWSSR